MKCPICKNELSETPMSMCFERSGKKNFCRSCMNLYSDNELQNIKDAYMIDEDTAI